ncbi:hypothetical protein [Streptomonospora mangrovi]|nr:hypothetical protein [Streptomonospora mangrovi]
MDRTPASEDDSRFTSLLLRARTTPSGELHYPAARALADPASDHL